MRLDAYLVDNKIVRSRERAKEHIKNGDVKVGGKAVLKPSYDVRDGEEVAFSGEKLIYVGRGGLKLEKALKCFGIVLDGKICMDIGASTGGFTDCMLQNGAAHVYAVDVGHGQLSPVLASDPRVTNMEGTNITGAAPDDFPETPEFISADVSFISLKKILPVISVFLGEGGEAAVLIKPQFEAGRSDIGKNGVVKDRKVHIRVLEEICDFCKGTGLSVAGLDFSPVSGGDGNIEYIAHIVPAKTFPGCAEYDIIRIVDSAFAELR